MQAVRADGWVLASSSPRRQELVHRRGWRPEVVAPPEEVERRAAARRGLGPVEQALEAARVKALAVARLRPGRFVVGADTVVHLDGEVMGKPADEQEAREMLRRLSGREHRVTTAVAVAMAKGGRAEVVAEGHCTSLVRFRELEDEEIDEYVASGEPMDKAGAYAIQGGAGRFVVSVQGPWDNVVGLPVELVEELLRQAAARAGVEVAER